MLPLTSIPTPISSLRTVELDTKLSKLSSSKSSWESITAGTETSTGLMYSTTVQVQPVESQQNNLHISHYRQLRMKKMVNKQVYLEYITQ